MVRSNNTRLFYHHHHHIVWRDIFTLWRDMFTVWRDMFTVWRDMFTVWTDMFHYIKSIAYIRLLSFKVNFHLKWQKISSDTLVDPLSPPRVIWWHCCNPRTILLSRIIRMAPKSDLKKRIIWIFHLLKFKVGKKASYL